MQKKIERHGWVIARPDGAKAKCGGPGLCDFCTAEQDTLTKFLEQEENKNATIQCQAKDCKKLGCRFCGGYGIIYEETKLGCGHKYWSKPGNYTYFEGKRFHSVDGLEIVCRMHYDWECASCYDRNSVRKPKE